MFTRLINKYYFLFASPEKYARHIGVKIGNNCWISTKKFSSEPYMITIGNYVRIAPETAFYTHGGVWSLRKKYKDPKIDNFGRISIGDYTYVGERCMIMAGVSIGSNCIVGGGSVVTRSIPDGVMVAGNPAKFIGYTEDFYYRIKNNSALCCKGLSESDKENYLKSLEDKHFIHKSEVSTKR